MWRSAFRNGEQNDGELRREDRKKTKKSRDKVEPAEIPDDSRNDKPATRRERLLSRKSKKKKNKNNAASSVDAKAMARASSEVEDTLDEVASLPHNRSRNSLSRFLLQRGGNNMRVVYRSFGPDASEVLNLEIEEGIPSPEQPNHVVIKIQASTVTLNDCLIRRGFDFSLFHPLSLPLTPGFDVVGHVIASGDKVEEFKEGDRVAALVRTGGNARFISVPCDSLVKIPRNIEPAEAAAMVSIFTTAYQALKRITQTGPMFSLQGKKVLILGGMDGVGQALIQMCHKARADIYTTAPTSRHTYIRTFLGVTPLPEDKEAWLPMVQGEIDFVFDGVCEDGLATPYKALKPDGELVCYGHAAMLQEREMGMFGAPMSAHMNNLWKVTMPRAKTVDIWDSFNRDPETYKKNLKSLFQLLKWNKIKPHVARRISLPEVASAQTKMENGDIRGIVVCLPWKRVGQSDVSRDSRDEVRE